MFTWIKKLLEDANGIPDDARVAAFLLVVAFIGLSVYAIHQGQPFNPLTWGGGAGALSSGIAAWFKLRGGN